MEAKLASCHLFLYEVLLFSLCREIFAFWFLLKTFFYKKTYAKTFAENRPFLDVLEHDAKV